MAQAVTGLVVVLALTSFFFSVTSRMCVLTHDHRAMTRCRQIIIAMRFYAADNNGAYPDSKVPEATDSNMAFRQLFVTEAIEDERIFGCLIGPFQADGEIGMPPDFIRALEPGENHWAMTKGANDTCPGTLPLVYENPVNAAWPPTWNADAAEQHVKGRTWADGKIVIGTADTSVELMKLSARRGTEVRLAPVKPSTENLFELERRFPDGSIDGTRYEVLDVAVRAK